ncbi:MAG TPA: hypothetical protein VF676_02195 [Flavobacterium sp.]
MKPILSLICCLSLFGCATIPAESVTLIDNIRIEGRRMHELNLTLVDNLINEKKQKVDEFITNRYTPMIIANVKKNAPAGTDWEKEFPEIMQAVLPEITRKQAEMRDALDSAGKTIVDDINNDYAVYDEACRALKELLESTAKVDAERKALLDQGNNLIGNKLDIDAISEKLDAFILKAGEDSANAIELRDALKQILIN